MKTFYSSLLLICFFSGCILQSPDAYSKKLVVKSIKDFGAVGDGITDDSYAFYLASCWFSNRNPKTGNALPENKLNINYKFNKGRLFIPLKSSPKSNGIYRIGKQVKFSKSKWGHTGSKFPIIFGGLRGGKGPKGTPINGLEIVGEIDDLGKRSEIKYLDNLYYGSFEKDSYKKIQGSSSSSSTHATPGTIQFPYYTNNITIKDLIINGNANNYIVGGYYSGNSYQIINYGIDYNGRGLLLENCEIKNFGTDGLKINSGYKTNLVKNKPNYIITNSTFSNCGRNNVALTGGYNFYFDNCSFLNPCSGKIVSSPGTALDIEGHAPVKKVIIKNSYFENTKGASGCLNLANKIDSCIFLNSTFLSKNPNKVAIQSFYTQNNNFVFKNCNITGSINFLKSNGNRFRLRKSRKDVARFEGCQITMPFSKRSPKWKPKGLIQVESDVHFYNCQIKNNRNDIPTWFKNKPLSNNNIIIR